LDPFRSPAARLKACTTIQFSKTRARFRGKRECYRLQSGLSILRCAPRCPLSTMRRDTPHCGFFGRIILEGPSVSADSTVKKESARTWRVAQDLRAKYSENISSSAQKLNACKGYTIFATAVRRPVRVTSR
jgi:hypothetical protein